MSLGRIDIRGIEQEVGEQKEAKVRTKLGLWELIRVAKEDVVYAQTDECGEGRGSDSVW